MGLDLLVQRPDHNTSVSGAHLKSLLWGRPSRQEALGRPGQCGEQGHEPELRFVTIPCKATQGPQVNLYFFPPHSPTAAIHTALSPTGRQHSPQQPLSYSFTRAVPSMQVSSLPPNPPGCLPASSISAVTSRIDSTQKTCSCRSGATNHWQPDGLRAQKMLKLSSKAAKQQGKALNPNTAEAGDCSSSAKDRGLPRYPLLLDQQTQRGLQQEDSAPPDLSRAAWAAMA